MSRPTTIQTPFPSLQETADILGVPVTQAERIQKLLSRVKITRRGAMSGRRVAKYAARKASKKA